VNSETNIRLEAYKILIDLLKYEGELIWSRTQVFLTINGAVIALLSWVWTLNGWGPIVITIGVCSISAFLNVIWVAVLRRGQVHSDYWNLQLKSLEGDLSPLTIYRELQRLREGDTVSLTIKKLGGGRNQAGQKEQKEQFEVATISIPRPPRIPVVRFVNTRVAKLLEIVAWVFVVGWFSVGVVFVIISIIKILL
jgi:hypothetical protein